MTGGAAQRGPGPLVRHVEPTLADATLVLAFEGWSDAGEAASLAASYLSEQLALAPLADLDLDGFLDLTVQRPRVRVDEGGARRIDWPALKLRYGSLDDERDLVLGVGPEPHLRWRDFDALLRDYAAELGVRRVVLLGAYLADVVYSRPVQVSGFASGAQGLQRLDVQPSRYEGPTGILGVLAEGFAARGCEVLSLWAGLPHYIADSPNPRGALALLQKLLASVDTKVDEEPLRREAADFEERVSAMVAADPELSEYVRELKRREFAQ